MLLTIQKKRGQFEKTEQVCLGEKEGERISEMRNTILHEAEKFWLEAIYEAKSVKESTMVLDI